MNKKLPIIIISGPTASGKTAFSIRLSKYLKEKNGKIAEVVNFDALLFYQKMHIGVAKPRKQEMAEVPHHLIDIVPITKDFNASDFSTLGRAKIKEIHKRKNIPILVGGSGFYLRALIKGMYQGGSTDVVVKRHIDGIYRTQGIRGVIELLQEKDPEILTILHPNDHYRLIRAAEFILQTGKKVSKQKEEMDLRSPYNFNEEEWNIHHIHLDVKKERHQEIIKARAQKMIQDGLIEEVKELLAEVKDYRLKPLRSVGYKETVQYILKQESKPEQLLERMVISTRRLAKAQRTFFKKVTPKTVFCPLSQQEEALRSGEKFLQKAYL